MKNYTEAIKKLKEAKNAIDELNQSDFNAAGYFIFAKESFVFLKTLFHYFSNHNNKYQSDAISNLQEEIESSRIKYETLQGKLGTLNKIIEEKEKEESKLQDVRRDYENKQARLKEIKNFKTAFEKVNLSELEEEIKKEESFLDEQFLEFEGKLKTLKELMTSIQMESSKQCYQMIKELSDNKELLKSVKGETLRKLDAELLFNQLEIKTFDREFEDKLKEYNRYLDKLKDIREQLNDLGDVHVKNLKIYTKYFAENKKIWGELEQRGQTKEYIDQKINDISESLAEFDEQLLEIITEKNKLVIMEYKPKEKE